MKAIVQDKYGPPEVLQLREVEKPVPKDDEVLVRVHAASVHADVWHVVSGYPSVLRLMGAGLSRPKNPIPGTDLAGTVESAGKNVIELGPGDAVFGESVNGFQWMNGGTYAEYVAVPARWLALKPPNVTFEQAASVPTSGYIAVQNFRAAGPIGPGHKVLVNGAGGGVGSIALQLAKAAGAEVTAVDVASKFELLRALGADHVIDYTKEDFFRGSERYDLVFDVASTLTLAEGRRALTKEGTYVVIGHDQYSTQASGILGSIPSMMKLMTLSLFVPQLRSKRSPADTRPPLIVMQELLEAGKLTPVIDRAFPLSEAPEALRYLMAGQARGRVVLTM